MNNEVLAVVEGMKLLKSVKRASINLEVTFFDVTTDKVILGKIVATANEEGMIKVADDKNTYLVAKGDLKLVSGNEKYIALWNEYYFSLIENEAEESEMFDEDNKTSLLTFRAIETYRVTRTVNGKPSKDNGDEIALTLEGLTVDQMYDVVVKFAKENSIDEWGPKKRPFNPQLIGHLKNRYGHLSTKSGSQNVGMIRMNLGNILRGMTRKINS